MPKTLGYMITWTTYGTWLQSDERGFVNNEEICLAVTQADFIWGC